MKTKLIVLLLAWYFAVGREVVGPFESRGHCQAQAIKSGQVMAECYCVLMFPTDCNGLVA